MLTLSSDHCFNYSNRKIILKKSYLYWLNYSSDLPVFQRLTTGGSGRPATCFWILITITNEIVSIFFPWCPLQLQGPLCINFWPFMVGVFCFFFQRHQTCVNKPGHTVCEPGGRTSLGSTWASSILKTLFTGRTMMMTTPPHSTWQWNRVSRGRDTECPVWSL